MSDREAVLELIEALLRDRDPQVREKVAWTLGQIRNARAVPGLETALSDQSDKVCLQAALSIGRIGNRSSVVALTKSLDQPVALPFLQRIAFTHPRISEIIMKIKPGVRKKLVEKAENVRDVQRATAIALRWIGGAEVIAGVRRLFADQNQLVRLAAA